MKKHLSIRIKLILIFLPVIIIVAIGISTTNMLYSQREIIRQIDEKVSNNLRYLVESMEHEFTSHRQIAESIATVYQTYGNKLSKSEYNKLIEGFLPMSDNTMGSGLWLEPYSYNEDTKYYGPYIYKDGSNFVYTEDYESAEYDYPSTDWYLIGKNAKDGVA